MKQFLILACLIFFLLKTNAQPSKKNNESIQKKIIGAWTYETTGNATFQISEASIFYVEHLVSYKYALKKDCIKIFFDDHILSGKINFKGDTMFIATKTDRQKYWPFKK